MPENLEARVEELEKKLQQLADREAIRSLRFRYHECINGQTFDAIPDLFSRDGVLDFDYLGDANNRDELKAFFKKVEKLVPFVKQFMHNHAIEAQEAETAKGYAYLEAKTISNGEAYFVAGRYDDEYVKEDGKWKFKKMSLTPYFTVPFKEGWAQEDRLKMGR